MYIDRHNMIAGFALFVECKTSLWNARDSRLNLLEIAELNEYIIMVCVNLKKIGFA